jgi:hypothetical protein
LLHRPQQRPHLKAHGYHNRNQHRMQSHRRTAPPRFCRRGMAWSFPERTSFRCEQQASEFPAFGGSTLDLGADFAYQRLDGAR